MRARLVDLVPSRPTYVAGHVRTYVGPAGHGYPAGTHVPLAQMHGVIMVRTCHVYVLLAGRLGTRLVSLVPISPGRLTFDGLGTRLETSMRQRARTCGSFVLHDWMPESNPRAHDKTGRYNRMITKPHSRASQLYFSGWLARLEATLLL